MNERAYIHFVKLYNKVYLVNKHQAKLKTVPES